MSDERFTKGPWHIGAAGEIRIETVNTGFGICVMADSEEIDEHNAALIVAAPEMYEEIKLDIQWLKRARDSFVIGSDMFRSCSLRIESKEKLLAKARGKK